MKQICTTKRLFPKMNEGPDVKWLLTNSKYDVDCPFVLGHFARQIKKNFKLSCVLSTFCDFPAYLEYMCGRQHAGRKTLQNAL